MQLWQLDVTGSVFLADGTECKLTSGIDGHSRYCVIATVVRRATARAVCRAFLAAMALYGIRLDGQLMHVLTQDRRLWRTLPCPIPPGEQHRLQGVRLAGPAPPSEATATVQRRVSSRGGIQVACQRIQVGMTHAGKIVTVIPQDNTFRLVIDGEDVGVVPRTTSRQIDRYKAYATRPGRR